MKTEQQFFILLLKLLCVQFLAHLAGKLLNMDPLPSLIITVALVSCDHMTKVIKGE